MKPAAEFVHPLDADDTDTLSTPIAESPGAYRRFMKWSVIVGAVSFFVALIGSVIGNNALGDPQLEAIANGMNRYGMLVLLLAALCILIAVRGPKIAALLSKRSAGGVRRSKWVVLFVFNLVGLLILSFLLISLGLVTGGGTNALAFGLLPVAIGLMLTIAVWHEGLVRAYAIGFTASMLMATGPGSIFQTGIGWWFSSMITRYGTYNANFSNGGFDLNAITVPMSLGILSVVALSAGSGLVCAAYVAVLEGVRRRAAMAKSQPEPKEMHTSVDE